MRGWGCATCTARASEYVMVRTEDAESEHTEGS